LAALAAAAALVALVGAAAPARAQAGRAGAPTPGEEPGDRVAIDAGITGNLSRGLVYRDLVSARGVVQLWRGPWGAYLQPYWLYSRIGTAAGRVTADDDRYLRTGAFRALSPRWFAFAVGVYDRNLRRRVDHRGLVGAGAGVDLVRAPGALLAASAGVLGEWTAFAGDQPLIDAEPGATAGPARATARWAVRAHGRYQLAGGRLALSHDLLVLPSWGAPRRDHRATATAALDAPIAAGLAARVQLDATRDTVIVEGTRRNAALLTFGVSYRGTWRRPPPAAPPGTR
jgi:hypothetical protein